MRPASHRVLVPELEALPAEAPAATTEKWMQGNAGGGNPQQIEPDRIVQHAVQVTFSVAGLFHPGHGHQEKSDPADNDDGHGDDRRSKPFTALTFPDQDR